MDVKLSEHFTYWKLVYFALPTIGMVLISITYDVIDGYFVSNYIGKTAFAAVNIVYPFQLALSTVGYMFGFGGSALVAAEMGKGEQDTANRYFTMIVMAAILCGIFFAAIGIVFLPDVAALIGATPEIMVYGLPYGRTLFLFLPIMLVGYAFQTLLITAEKPQLGLYISIANMFSNIVLDYLFIVIFGWGMVGAAAATGIGACLNGIIPLVYFARPNSSVLHFVKFRHFELKPLISSCANGASEMVEDLSTALIFVFYNIQLLRFLGEDGVAAYGVVVFVEGFFTAVFAGLAMEATSVVGYHFGAQNFTELKSLLKKGVVINLVCGVAMLMIAWLIAPWIADVYVGYDDKVCALATHALKLYAFAFVLQGFCVYSSAYFTGLNNGKVSASIAFMRSFVFQTAAIFGLPVILGVEGLWISQAVAEVLAALVASACFVIYRHEYSGKTEA